MTIGGPSNLGTSHTRILQLSNAGVDRNDKSVFGDILRKGYDDDFEPARKPSQPTTYAPGSVGKLCVLALRLMAGEELYHVDDATTVASHEEQRELCLMLAKNKGKRRVDYGTSDT